MAKKKQYYSIKNLEAKKAPWNILLGERAGGKSYQVKLKCLTEAYEDGKQFIYLRRWQQDIKQAMVTAYFDDMSITTITKGQYTGCIAYQGYIYFTWLDENDELQKSKPIGRYCDLHDLERYKSQVFDGVCNIIYEEFITDQVYLPDEPRMLQQFVSTVARHRQIQVWLIGNTLSRVCPYFSYWSLEGVLKMKPGQIDVYHFHETDKNGNQAVIDVAVEYCASIGYENKMYFGTASKQIVGGEWDVHDLPKLPEPYEFYDMLYEMCVDYQKFKFIMQLLYDDKLGATIVYVYPLTTKRKVNRILTDMVSTNPNISARLKRDRRAEILISECFADNKVFYSDNLTGTDFRTVIDYFKLGTPF